MFITIEIEKKNQFLRNKLNRIGYFHFLNQTEQRFFLITPKIHFPK